MTTVQFTGSDPLTDILDTLLQNLSDALAATAAGLPKRMEIVHGAGPVLDSLPMGWVRPVRMYPSTEAFGAQDRQFVPRKQPFRWAVDVELGAARCVTVIQQNGSTAQLPSAAQITGDTATVIEDARALRIAVQYLQKWRGNVMIGAWAPLPATGGVGGGTVQISVPFNDQPPTIT